jgi:hypothetical protein
LRKSVVWWLNDIGWLVVWIIGFFSLWLVNFIIPTDFHISQRGRSTTNDIVGGMWLNVVECGWMPFSHGEKWVV